MKKQRGLKVKNIRDIRHCFYTNDVCTVSFLEEACGLSHGAVVNVVQYLLESKEIIRIEDRSSKSGRKSKQYVLNPGCCTIGTCNIRKEKNRVRIAFDVKDMTGSVLEEERIEEKTYSISLLESFLEKMLKKNPNLSLITIAIPGVSVNCVVQFCDLTWLQGWDAGIFAKKHSIDVIVENDVNAACIGMASSYTDVQSLALIYQPKMDYVGCGYVINGALYNGMSHFAGELRYLPYYDHKEQDKLLKKNPQKLLREQIETLICTINPEVIGYCSDVFEGEELKMEKSDIDPIHFPQFVRIDNLEECIRQGLFAIAKQYIEQHQTDAEGDEC